MMKLTYVTIFDVMTPIIFKSKIVITKKKKKVITP